MSKPTKLTPEIVARCRRAANIVASGYRVEIAVRRARTSPETLSAYLRTQGKTVADLRKGISGRVRSA